MVDLLLRLVVLESHVLLDEHRALYLEHAILLAPTDNACFSSNFVERLVVLQRATVKMLAG
jgi:hypothetical protein